MTYTRRDWFLTLNSQSLGRTVSFCGRLPSTHIEEMSFDEGTYIIYNFAADSVFDLSGADQKTIIGFPHHGFENQQVSQFD